MSAGPVYSHVDIERTLVQTANYLLDIVDAHSTDGASHKFDWFYHNFGALTTAIPLMPFAGLPQANGYQHLSHTMSAVTGGELSIEFAQPGANLRLEVLGSKDSRIVTGEGLGPDLRVPVPFVMVRREGTSARFVALYVPYRDGSPVTSFRVVGDTEYQVAGDRISVAAGGFRVGH